MAKVRFLYTYNVYNIFSPVPFNFVPLNSVPLNAPSIYVNMLREAAPFGSLGSSLLPPEALSAWVRLKLTDEE